MRNTVLKGLICCSLLLLGLASEGCNQKDKPKDDAAPLTLTLDWKPEPEFGGFYAAQHDGIFKKHGIELNIVPQGTDTWRLVATGKSDFATSAADQVMTARDNGADIIAFFAVYQDCPQGVMVHKSRGFKSLEDVFKNDGNLFAEKNSWLDIAMKKYAGYKVNIGQYSSDSGIQPFLSGEKNSQQCFVTSEPLLAKSKGSDPQTFLVAETGYNPYTTVVICKGELWRNNPDKVKAMAAACREGWRAYQDNPAAANAVMVPLHKEMDAQTFTEAAAAQKSLIETDESHKNGIGTMTADRWNALGKQLLALDKIKTAPKAEDCFVNP